MKKKEELDLDEEMQHTLILINKLNENLKNDNFRCLVNELGDLEFYYINSECLDPAIIISPKAVMMFIKLGAEKLIDSLLKESLELLK